MNEQYRAAFKTGFARHHTFEALIKSSPEANRLQNLSKNEWLKLTRDQYVDLEVLTAELFRNTKDINPIMGVSEKMVANYETLVLHMKIMQGLVSEYWPALKKFYPEGTTLEYAFANVLGHEFSRFSNINGWLPLLATDRFSDKQIAALAPDWPLDEHINHIEQITGQHTLPQNNSELTIEQKLQLIFGTFDMFGKPDERDPDTFLEEGSGYSKWVELQKSKRNFPICYNERGENGLTINKIITAEQYAREDIDQKKRGISLIQEIGIPLGLDFKTVLKQVRNKVNLNKESNVRDFGIRTIRVSI